ncbi:transporter [Erysipelothrix larvae]|uniref:Transporter n=1 Tax=Erysipelothrix larvae TaxID=1514105 RepID=A0A0X8GZF4_9FIRM|nr:energy-coupling factor transporter transmembrane component T [Erysipelothrix larvae]AMC93074.1 transporter [Erysipelothrix larvae]
MKNIALGRYIPLNSIVHKLDPRMKICSMIVLMTSIFLVGKANALYAYGLIGLFLIVAILSAKLTFGFILKSLKPMMFMLVFLTIINIFQMRTGRVLVSIGDFKIYSDALTQTLFIVVRLVFMIMITTLLTATTTPLDLTLGIEDLLSPFKKMGVPAHEIAMMISIALRFIPILIEDTQRIMNAQSSRGVDFKEGSFKEKILGVVSLIIPLFVSVLHRAEDLADSMEARGYYPGLNRTRYKQLSIKFMDLFVFVLCIALCVGVFMIRRIPVL